MTLVWPYESSHQWRGGAVESVQRCPVTHTLHAPVSVQRGRVDETCGPVVGWW